MFRSAAILIVVNIVFAVGSNGQTDGVPSADEVIRMASEAANVPNFNASALPVEEAKVAMREKCEQNGGPGAYEKAENATKEFETCVRSLVNVTQLTEEMEPAKKTGDLDTVFKKYCNKRPILQACVQKATDAAGGCFSAEERESIRLLRNITDSLLSFVCFKDGDRIALFIAAGGPECFASKQTVIQQCANSTFGKYIPAEGLPTSPANLDNFPMMILDTQKCQEIDLFQQCIVRELETCSDPTPGNIADSLFNFIKKVTPCDNMLKKARADRSFGEKSASSSTIIGAHMAVVLSLVTLGFV